MSTLKKILSLSLALAMLMSVSVFAGFADEATIDADAKAAVELLTAVKILNGIEKEDGTFDFAPTATIKRAEAAKMIYVLRNGGVDDKAETWKGVVSFADCKDHWAAGYIAYCEAYGLINGRTETVFDPEAPVTGVELAKMLLTTAGYSTDVEGFTGTGWEKNVVAEANAVELFKGVEFAISEAAPRQWAAVMFKNAFAVKVPTYIGDYRVDGILTGVTTKTVQEKYLKFKTETAVVLSTTTATVDGTFVTETGKKTELDYASTEMTDGNVAFAVADALVGQQVTVTFIDTKIVSIVATGKTIAGELKVGAAIEAGKTDEGKYPVSVAGVSFGNKEGTFEIDGADVADIYAYQSAKRSSLVVTAYDFTGDKTIDAVTVVDTTYGKVNSIVTTGDNKGDFKVGGLDVDVSDAKVTVNGTMKAGIVAKYTEDSLTGKITVAPAEMVVGAFTGVSGNATDGYKYTVNGAEFEIGADAISGETAFLATDNLKKTAVLYTDGKYVVLAKEFEAETVTPDDPTELPANLAMLIEAKEVTTSATTTDEWGNVTNTPTTVTKVQVLLADGTTVILPYETASAIVKDADHITATEVMAAAEGDVFEYVITANAKILFKQTLPTVEDVNYYGTNTAGAQGAAVTFDTAKKMLNGITGKFIMATENTKVFVKYVNDKDADSTKWTTEYKVMKLADLVAYEYTGTGEGIKLIAATNATIGEALLATAVVSYKAPTAPQATPVAHYVIATSTVDYVVKGDKIYKTFTAIDLKNNCAVATFETEVKTTGTVDTAVVEKDAILKIETTNNLVTKVEVATGWTPAAITAKAADLLLINGDTVWQTGTAFDSACKFIVKDANGAYSAGSVASLVVAKKTNNQFNENISYVLVGGTGANAAKIAYIIIDLAK